MPAPLRPLRSLRLAFTLLVALPVLGLVAPAPLFGAISVSTSLTWSEYPSRSPDGTLVYAKAAAPSVTIQADGLAPDASAVPAASGYPTRVWAEQIPATLSCPAVPGAAVPRAQLSVGPNSGYGARVDAGRPFSLTYEATWLDEDGYDVAPPAGAYRVCVWTGQLYDDPDTLEERLAISDVGQVAFQVPADRPPTPLLGDTWELDDLTGSLAVRPRLISFGATSGVRNLRWSSWGGSRARASGVWLYRHYPRKGGATSYPLKVTLTANRLVRCADLRVYTQIIMSVKARRLPPGLRTRNKVIGSPKTRRVCASA